MKISVDSEEISTLCEKAGRAVLSDDGEKSLARLMSIHKQIGDFIEVVKKDIKDNALKLDKNFTGYNGDYVKLELRKFGSVYAIEQPEVVPKEFLKTKTTVSLDTKKVEEYEIENKELPYGVERLEREPQIVIKLKEN